MSLPYFFFFFQAEDGIRDHCVTGVQTCALPISRTGSLREEHVPGEVAPLAPVLDSRARRGLESGGGRVGLSPLGWMGRRPRGAAEIFSSARPELRARPPFFLPAAGPAFPRPAAA